jgi:hypothetical protein
MNKLAKLGRVLGALVRTPRASGKLLLDDAERIGFRNRLERLYTFRGENTISNLPDVFPHFNETLTVYKLHESACR